MTESKRDCLPGLTSKDHHLGARGPACELWAHTFQNSSAQVQILGLWVQTRGWSCWVILNSLTVQPLTWFPFFVLFPTDILAALAVPAQKPQGTQSSPQRQPDIRAPVRWNGQAGCPVFRAWLVSSCHAPLGPACPTIWLKCFFLPPFLLRDARPSPVCGPVGRCALIPCEPRAVPALPAGKLWAARPLFLVLEESFLFSYASNSGRRP